MAYLLYKHFKSQGGDTEKPATTAKPVKLCEHQRDISLNNLSEFSTTPQALLKDAEDSGHPPALTPDGPCVLCKEEKRAARVYRWKLIAGLFLPFSVQALDTTIVAGALPFIASDFSKLPFVAHFPILCRTDDP